MPTPIQSPPPADRVGALLGLVGVVGNVAGVAFLWNVPVAYRPTDLDRWAALSWLHPDATVASALSFVVGLLALAAWASALGRSLGSPWARLGASTIAVGAVVNAAGCVAPIVLVRHLLPGCATEACAPAARVLLGLTLSFDALFNLLLGVGLVAIGAVLLRTRSRWMGAFGIVAGLVSIPVSGQPFSEDAARLLAVAGPLWLAFVLLSSAGLWRGAPTPR